MTAGLLILLKWALILLNLCNTGLKVLLAMGWEWDSTGELELRTMGWGSAGLIEVTSRNKETRAGSSIGVAVFREVQAANLREWFCELVCFGATWFACVHWCCLLVWWAAKNGSFLCFVQETEYPFMSIQNRRTNKERTPKFVGCLHVFQIINNWSWLERERETEWER